MHGSHPKPSPHPPSEVGLRPDDMAVRLVTSEQVRRGRKPGKGGELGWASLPPEVLDSCSVALRRMGDSELRSIAVTSTARGEGRTTIAVGMAATSANELRQKTILVDLDLERGSLEHVAAVGPGPGVVDFLFEEANVDDCIRPVDRDLAIIRAGVLRDRVETATRLGRLPDFIEQLRQRCDVLIADLPPLTSGVTTARTADLFQSVALVVRAGSVAVPEIEQTASVLSQRAFMILNGTASNRASWIGRLLRLQP
jgi:Mrp family chromosome partitioning ATPase